MKVVVIVSGGMDSAVLLENLVRDEGAECVKALSVNYGQRHMKELGYAQGHAENLGVEWRRAYLAPLKPMLGGSSQTDSSIPVPEGHYAEDAMKQTVVPNRNMLMLSVAAAWAISSEFDAVAYGAHACDHAVYPGRREEFAQAMAAALALCDWRRIELLRPFSEITKADIVTLGAELGLDFAETWSCYKGGDRHCGRCGPCVARREAFRDAGVDDPTEWDCHWSVTEALLKRAPVEDRKAEPDGT